MAWESRMEGVTYVAQTGSLRDELVSIGNEVRNQDTYIRVHQKLIWKKKRKSKWNARP